MKIPDWAINTSAVGILVVLVTGIIALSAWLTFWLAGGLLFIAVLVFGALRGESSGQDTDKKKSFGKKGGGGGGD